MREIMIAELSRLKKQINDLQQQLKQLPEGTFYTAQNGKYKKWFCYVNGRTEPIRKTNRSLAVGLASAAFIRFRLEELKKDVDATNAYLRNASDKDLFSFFEEHPDLRELLGNYGSMSVESAEWAATPYKRPDIIYKGTLYKTLKGDLVKSRAEQMIADTLFLAGIPYRYECGITFNNGKTWFYPDFMIMHPRTGEILLWEHFGMEDLEYYRHKNANKMYVYFDNGFIPGKNLICTVSNDQIQLTPARIQANIHEYLS